MKRPAASVGQQPTTWLLFIIRLQKYFKLQYSLTIFIVFIVLTYLRIVNYTPTVQMIITRSEIIIEEEIITINFTLLNKCNSRESKSLFRSTPLNNNDSRPQPTIQRLNKLFRILISHEDRYRQIFNYLGIFRFSDFRNTLRPLANNTERLENILCRFQQYMNISDDGHIDIKPSFIDYLRQVSIYLSDGFKNQHSAWNKISKDKIQKPVIILAANAQFYDTLQASMRTINEHLQNHTIAIYDLQFNPNQLSMIKANCDRCIIIPFPFAQIEPVAGHIRTIGNFAWKPIVIQDAIQRFGSIIYGDTSIRYKTSNFDRLLVDNLIRGFSCRELPGHYLPCFTLTRTFSWFNETFSTFNDIYIAEAGFLAVTDNFLSRLILKTWVTCALDSNCIAPSKSKSQCKRVSGTRIIHRYDQSAMVTALSFYFFPSPRQNDKTDPAPYDMYTSIQEKVAEVRRFEGDQNYFTRRPALQMQQNSSTATV
ncbi:unnamed protein product [Rotaria socialis]|uniref:Uncharacterized protein n=1 Tax=Rotaria socialis TaxID=392032 RepID=A0A820Q592_9BILA|nr:unnamed protein product [Rotaria socialis]CAF4417442.1 unnamed protein product [Rotaria socialis]